MPLRGTLNDENWHRAWYHLAVGAVSTLTHGQTGFRHYSDSNRNSMNVPPTALTLWGQGGVVPWSTILPLSIFGAVKSSDNVMCADRLTASRRRLRGPQ